MSVEQELIERVLECAAEDDPRLNETIYKNFYEAMPDAEQLLSHVDEGTRGKMIAEIYRLLLAEDVAASDGDYLMFETKTHANSYFVLPEMYNVLSDVFLQTLRLSAAREWSPTVEAVVSRRLNSRARAINSAVIKNCSVTALGSNLDKN